MAVSLMGIALLLCGSRAPSQEPGAAANTNIEAPTAEPPKVLHFTKPPNTIARPSCPVTPEKKADRSEVIAIPTMPALPSLVRPEKTALPIKGAAKPAPAPLALTGGIFADSPATAGQSSQTDVPLRLSPLPVPAREPAALPAVEPKPAVVPQMAMPSTTMPPPPPAVKTGSAISAEGARSKAGQVAPPTARYPKKTLPPVRDSSPPGATAAVSSRGVHTAAFQAPSYTRPQGEEGTEYQVQLEPPGPQRLFRLESEAQLQERMRQEARERPTPERIAFPEEPIATGGPVFRQFPAANMLVEPNYVCYGRLYFTELNSERYGWDLGPLQPFVSAGTFFWDMVALPYHIGTDPCRCYECSAGYCLPGDPVPYLCYPPTFNLTGLMLEAGTAVALFAIFP